MKTKDAKRILKRRKKKVKLTKDDFLSTGLTCLNLACTGKVNRGFQKGGYYNIVGDSMSGKTFLTLTMLAEASIRKSFKDYRFIFDDVEQGAKMDVKKYFGQKLYDKLETPSRVPPYHSHTIESFYFNITDLLKDGQPFIYILDSMDSLTSLQSIGKFEQIKKAVRTKKDYTGSYGDGKAKINSEYIRQLLTPLSLSGSILIVVSQTRSDLGFSFAKKSKSGGKALRFYATMEIWSSVKERIHKTIQGKKRRIGSICQIEVRKNRQVGETPKIFAPIYPSHGFDDVGANVDYLISEKHWKKSDSIVKATELDTTLKRESLIQYIERENLEKQLKKIVRNVWHGIEDAKRIKRKKRY